MIGEDNSTQKISFSSFVHCSPTLSRGHATVHDIKGLARLLHGPSIGPSVRRSVRPSVRPSVGVIELKSGKMSVLDTFYVCLCEEWGLGCGLGLDAPAHLSATIL